jgi:hypothetical protein
MIDGTVLQFHKKFSLLYFSCLFHFRNLQGAVCSYFDFESPHKLPSMSLVKDVTIGEGESIPPCTK